ncbi:MAG: RNA polymerase sporulation sigma factor SigH [Butyrivibrio sp.]|nr:RNA polymerase sporulation sigma factor SigH [Butyrivibrio sp.]
MNDEYSKMSDEELVAMYHKGDSGAADRLVNKYKNLVRMKARAFFLTGADNDDLLQEGMIGLYKAIRDYNSGRDTVFMTFASLCIGRQIRTAITAYNRMKNSPLNTYISLDTPVTDEMGDDARLGDVIPSEGELNPEALLINKEQTERFIEALYGNLSKLELQVLELYREGLSYGEIATHLNKTTKAVDNAIQRIRSKINNLR